MKPKWPIRNKFSFRKIFFFEILYLVLSLVINAQAFAQTEPLKKFIAIADIHFNPFIGCDQLSHPCPILNELRVTSPASWNSIFKKYTDTIKTKYHQDTDYLLLQSMQTELKTIDQEQKPAFILVLGDWLAHQFSEQYKKYASDTSNTERQAFIQHTFQYLTYQLNQAVPVTNVYPVLGNNDSYGKNYEFDPKSHFLQETTDTFASLIKNKNNRQKFLREFSESGYYAVSLTKENQRLIVLNSVLFSALRQTPVMQKAAATQLDWLETQLMTAKKQHQTVLLALHIPSGIDVWLYGKMRFDVIRNFWPPLFWQPDDNARFLSLLQKYSTVIAGILPGHIHVDAFQLIAGKTPDTFIPVSFTPAISPVYRNNPGLKVFSYHRQTLQLIDFITYFYPLNEGRSAKWKQEYDFNAAYQPHCKQCTLVNGMLRLAKENTSLADFMKNRMFVNRNPQPMTMQRMWMPYYGCAIYNMDWQSYKGCVGQR